MLKKQPILSSVPAQMIRENLTDILGRVKYQDEIVTVEKKGKPWAVLVSVERYRILDDHTKGFVLDKVTEKKEKRRYFGNKRY